MREISVQIAQGNLDVHQLLLDRGNEMMLAAFSFGILFGTMCNDPTYYELILDIKV